MEIFTLIKNSNFDKIYEIIKNKEIKNFDIKDEHYNYFIQYIINYNQINIIKLILELSKKNNINIRIDIFDSDGRTLLYNCVKFNYYEMCKLLIEYNKSTIGISIINIKDILGYTSLHYAIIFNNLEIFKLLLSNNADPYLVAKDGNNGFILCLMYNRLKIFNYLLKNTKFIDFRTNNNESILQVAINYQSDIIYNLLEFNINLNNVSNDFGLAIIHQTIILDNLKLFKILLDKNINFNLSDFLGNTPLHYIMMDLRFKYLDIFILKIKDIQFNLSNINGDIPLHILLDKNIDFKEHVEIIKKIIIESDLNIQNNQGITCLMKIVSNNLLNLFEDVLRIKPLNFFIEDNNFNHIQITDDILILLVDSYYNQIRINKKELLIDWEKWCSVDLFDKLKTLINNKEIIGKTSEEICKSKIKQVIKKERRTLPGMSKLNLILDNGIFTNFCFYTGSPIDVLFGLLLLNNDFKNKGFSIIIDYPLTINESLEIYYQKLGLDYPYKLDFSNIEIMWCYQKIFFPSFFDDIVIKKIKENNYVAIPIGIITSVGSHANIIFWDIKNKTIERFEPNGSNFPTGLNYNPSLLDNLLENKFKQFDKDIIYYAPYKFLPSISFQKIESLEIKKCKIGDPNGFCGVWCIWWVYQRMLNIKNDKLTLENMAVSLINQIKLENTSFKSIIRNFSKKITEIRDSFLKKYSIDINDWILGSYNNEILNNLEKDVFKVI